MGPGPVAKKNIVKHTRLAGGPAKKGRKKRGTKGNNLWNLLYKERGPEGGGF